MPEFITIKMSRDAYDSVLDILPPHQVKEVKIVDDRFVGDDVHRHLKLESDAAYKKLMKYEFKKRNP